MWGKKRKLFEANLMKQVIELAEGLGRLRCEIGPRIEAEVRKNLGDKLELIEGSIRESIVQKEVLIDKGFLTRDEVNAKYAELRSKANG